MTEQLISRPARAIIGAALAFVLFTALILLGGCARETPLIEGPAHPPMWEATRGDTRIILIGAVHQLPPKLDWQDKRVQRAMNEADALVLELSPAESGAAAAVFAKMARDEPVAALDRRIGAVNGEATRDWLKDAGMNADDIDATESWALSLSLSSLFTQMLGISDSNGVETVLTRHFQQQNKPVRGLETAASQLALFNAVAKSEQNSMLSRTLREQPLVQQRTRALLQAWANGDTTTLARLVDEEMATTPDLAEPLVYARNRRWTDILSEPANGHHVTLVAVGTGHLIGPQSLPDLLAERGFTVHRIES